MGVAVDVGVRVGVGVRVDVGVRVAVAVDVGVRVGVCVAVGVGVRVGVDVEVGVGVAVEKPIENVYTPVALKLGLRSTRYAPLTGSCGRARCVICPPKKPWSNGVPSGFRMVNSLPDEFPRSTVKVRV